MLGSRQKFINIHKLKKQTMSGLTRKERKSLRQSEALERQKGWDNLTPQQRLNDLDLRLGKGVGAIKQRAKLKYIIEHPQTQNQKKGKSKKSKNVKNS